MLYLSIYNKNKKHSISIQNYKTRVKMKYKLETLEMLSPKKFAENFPTCTKHAKTTENLSSRYRVKYHYIS